MIVFCGSYFLTVLLIERTNPIANELVIKDEPPYDKNGTAIPFIGIIPEIPAPFIKNATIIIRAIPVVKRWNILLSTFLLIAKILNIINIKIVVIRNVPIQPISSVIPAITKSVWTSLKNPTFKSPIEIPCPKKQPLRIILN